jgi:hypothetical protein
MGLFHEISVPDPDPYVFGPLGSGLLVRIRTQEKTINSTDFCLLNDTLSLKTDVNVYRYPYQNARNRNIARDEYLYKVLKINKS